MHVREAAGGHAGGGSYHSHVLHTRRTRRLPRRHIYSLPARPATAQGDGRSGHDRDARAAGARVAVSPAEEFHFHLVFSNKTESDTYCISVWQSLTARRVAVWQQKKNIPKDSDNWFNEWYPAAEVSIKIVCFLTAAYLKSPYCMKEFGRCQRSGRCIVGEAARRRCRVPFAARCPGYSGCGRQSRLTGLRLAHYISSLATHLVYGYPWTQAAHDYFHCAVGYVLSRPYYGARIPAGNRLYSSALLSL
eukprot:COSAG06_NODE_1240_length_10123_cov_19.440343_3_plen_248_part_00